MVKTAAKPNAGSAFSFSAAVTGRKGTKPQASPATREHASSRTDQVATSLSMKEEAKSAKE